jgi:Mg-chelatase subunit ChlD
MEIQVNASRSGAPQRAQAASTSGAQGALAGVTASISKALASIKSAFKPVGDAFVDALQPTPMLDALVKKYAAEFQAMIEMFQRNPGMKLVYAIDQSGSTVGEIIERERTIGGLLVKAAQQTNSEIAVVGFDDRVRLLKAMSSGTTDSVFKEMNYSGGGTSFAVALKGAEDQLSGDASKKVIVLATDGMAEPMGSELKKLEAKGITLALLGFSDNGFGEALENRGVELAKKSDYVKTATAFLQSRIGEPEGLNIADLPRAALSGAILGIAFVAVGAIGAAYSVKSRIESALGMQKITR